MSVILRTAAISDRGKVRENNEDSVHVGPRLIAVADGVGGGPSGEIASDIVIREMATLEDGTGTLDAAVDAANRRLREAVEADGALEGMGTTLTAMLAVEDALELAHVGDSRAYLWRDGELSQLSRDDTFVQGLVDQGILSAAEARAHPQRALVTQAMHGARIDPSFIRIHPRQGDRYLLCSDGLSDYVDDGAIARSLGNHHDLPTCAQELVDLALDAGAPDNVTVVVAEPEW
jgi:PPM family protein phosphatase